MKKFAEFIREESAVFIILLYVLATFGGIFIFARMDMSYFWLGTEIMIFGLVIYLSVKWLMYRKSIDLSHELEETRAENISLKNQIICERRDLEEYFLTWVHQIKTPITVARLLLRKDEGENAVKLREQIFYIEEYTSMAINYLKLQDRQADMDITEVCLDDIIKPLLKKYSMFFIEKHISLQYESIHAGVVADSKWLSVLVEQILSNAVKYTSEGQISIFYDPDANALGIRDTGIGIRQEDKAKIFDRGYSGFNGRINEKSSGLGLYLARQIEKLLNVRVGVESVLNEGSTFYIYFQS